MLNSSAQSTVIPRTVLVVEDEPTLATAIAQRITAEGWTARVASDGASAVQAASTLRPDLVIMDIMLPVMDGLEATKRIVAERPVPVLILTARDDEADKVIGLGAGADDYMTKPFSMRELIARCKALLRRVEMDRGKTAAEEDELHYGDIRYSATENAVFCGSTIVALTQTELRLLSYMMKQPEKAYSREELLSAVWGFDSEVETRVTDETLRRIRKKLLQAGSTVSVSTIWGFGYKLKGAECT